jgi:hypothetical protein
MRIMCPLICGFCVVQEYLEICYCAALQHAAFQIVCEHYIRRSMCLVYCGRTIILYKGTLYIAAV